MCEFQSLAYLVCRLLLEKKNPSSSHSMHVHKNFFLLSSIRLPQSTTLFADTTLFRSLKAAPRGGVLKPAVEAPVRRWPRPRAPRRAASLESGKARSKTARPGRG